MIPKSTITECRTAKVRLSQNKKKKKKITLPTQHRYSLAMYIKVVTVNHLNRDKYLFRDYLNVECYFLHDVNSFRKCFSHLLHTVKILHWLLNISVLFQQLKLP